jgi:hypothetical protein
VDHSERRSLVDAVLCEDSPGSPRTAEPSAATRSAYSRISNPYPAIAVGRCRTRQRKKLVGHTMLPVLQPTRTKGALCGTQLHYVIYLGWPIDNPVKICESLISLRNSCFVVFLPFPLHFEFSDVSVSSTATSGTLLIPLSATDVISREYLWYIVDLFSWRSLTLEREVGG